MFKNYLKIALRTLRKQIGYTSINLIGLAVGIACGLLILLFVRDELGFDRFHEKADQIHRVVLTGHFAGNDLNAPITPAPMAAALVADFPEVLTATRISPPRFTGQMMVQRDDKKFLEEGLAFVDSTFFDIFTFPLLQGNPKTALEAPRTIVLTQSMAEKYFSGEDPINQTLILADTSTYRVTGVIADVPSNSHFQFDFLASITSLGPQALNEFWISNNFFTYLVLQPGYDPAQLEAKLTAFFKQYAGPQIYEALGISFDEFVAGGNTLNYSLQALTDIHLHSHMQFELSPNGDITYVYLFSVVAVFILLIACINFMNLATARSAGRAKEVGMRKALGSSRAQLVRQFLTESTLLAFLATVLAVGLVVLLLPSFNTLAGKEISAAFLGTAPVLLGLVALAVMVGFLAGSYPAFYLSAFRPATVLKGTIQAGKRRSLLRDGLVVFQFAISIGLIAGTLVVYNQLNYVRNKTLGFDKEHVVVIQRAQELDDQTTAFKQELLTHSAVVSVSSMSSMPGGLIGQTAYQPEGASGNETFIMAPVFADFDYAKTLGMEIATGRDVSRDFATDTTVYLINEAAVKALDWEDPLGKHLVQIGATQSGAFNGEIVGVLKDFHFASLHQEIGALTVRVFEGPLPFIAVRIRPDDIPGALSFMEEKWRTFAPDQPFEYSFLDQDFDALYQAEQRLGKIFIAFAIFAILIACLGLFGLASFTAEQRTKEIGVRKVLGASVPQLVVLLSKEFTLLVVIAFVIAAPLSFFAMKDWLKEFAYHANIGLEIYVLAGVLALVIAWLTVSYQSIRAAMANPVDSLRYE